MSNSTISIRVNDNLKEQAQALFKSWGLDMSTAVNIFLSQTVREQRIPFIIGDGIPNAETAAAIEELENGGGTVFQGSTEDLLSNILED